MRAPVLVFVGSLVACAGGSSSSSRADDIIDGKASAGHPAVGVVRLSAAQSFCTGTLIAPNVVLTAGHCIEGDEIADAFFTGAGKAVADSSTDPATLGMVRHAVIEQLRYPTFEYFYSCPNAELDVALLRLETPVTDIEPVALGSAPGADTECTAVGFGMHEADGGEEFLGKREAQVKIVGAPRPTSLDVGAVTGIARHGDSGGPLLCDGKLVATTSCEPDWPYDVVAYGNVSAGASWIAETTAKWAP